MSPFAPLNTQEFLPFHSGKNPEVSLWLLLPDPPCFSSVSLPLTCSDPAIRIFADPWTIKASFHLWAVPSTWIVLPSDLSRPCSLTLLRTLSKCHFIKENFPHHPVLPHLLPPPLPVCSWRVLSFSWWHLICVCVYALIVCLPALDCKLRKRGLLLQQFYSLLNLHLLE